MTHKLPAWLDHDPTKLFAVAFYDDGALLEFTYISSSGETHAIDRVAAQSWHPNGVKRQESWIRDGKMHRENGPASLIWNAAGTLILESWHVDGDFHRLDGPALVTYNDEGQIIHKRWHIKGMMTRRELYDATGAMTFETDYL